MCDIFPATADDLVGAVDQLQQTMDQNPAIVICLVVLLLFLVWRARKRKHLPSSGLLDQVLFHWSPHDPFTIRDLLRSIAIFGASGSGKSSGSGYQLASTPYEPIGAEVLRALRAEASGATGYQHG
jgi:hypothetical protein